MAILLNSFASLLPILFLLNIRQRTKMIMPWGISKGPRLANQWNISWLPAIWIFLWPTESYWDRNTGKRAGRSRQKKRMKKPKEFYRPFFLIGISFKSTQKPLITEAEEYTAIHNKNRLVDGLRFLDRNGLNAHGVKFNWTLAFLFKAFT